MHAATASKALVPLVTMLFFVLRNGIASRHSDLQQWLLDSLHIAGIPASREAALPNGSRPADILIHHWHSGKPLAIDLTIGHPLRLSCPNPTPATALAFLSQEESRKSRKYDDTCKQAGWDFAPLVVHPWAGLTPSGVTLFSKICRHFTEHSLLRPTPAENVSFFWQTFSATIMKA